MKGPIAAEADCSFHYDGNRITSSIDAPGYLLYHYLASNSRGWTRDSDRPSRKHTEKGLDFASSTRHCRGYEAAPTTLFLLGKFLQTIRARADQDHHGSGVFVGFIAKATSALALLYLGLFTKTQVTGDIVSLRQSLSNYPVIYV